MKEEDIRKTVRDRYAMVAKRDNSCCAPVTSCCGRIDARDVSMRMGYTKKELEAVPNGANLGLGCGNPVALASLKEGDTVLDLGSGAGFDVFLAANKVGKNGKVIGVDMTPEMIEKARENAKKGNYSNVEFRLGEIENLPVADNSVDVIISNCVINLALDKKRVFAEAYRVIRPGGRLMVSDIVLLRALPDSIKNSAQAYVACLAGAMMKSKYLETIDRAGFREVKVIDETTFPAEYVVNDPAAKAIIEGSGMRADDLKEIADGILSVKVSATKPEKTT